MTTTLDNNLTARTLHAMNAKKFREYRPTPPDDRKPLTAAAIATGYEVVKECISRLAPNDDALWSEIVGIEAAIDGYLEPDEDRPSAAEKARVEEIVRTFTAGASHEAADVRDALIWVRDYAYDFGDALALRSKT